MNALAQTHRGLVALTALASGRKVTQRSLAATLGVSLGLVNALLRRLESDGLIRVDRVPALRGTRYRITRSGLSALREWRSEFAVEAEPLLGGLRDHFQHRIVKLADKGKSRVLLFGSGPLADVAASVILNAGMKLVGVVSADIAADRVAGVKVRSFGQADRVRCDAVVALTKRDANAVRKHLVRRVPVTVLLSCAAERRLGRGS